MPLKQLPLFEEEFPTGEELRDSGIKKALDHAEQVTNNWGDKAYIFLQSFAKTHDVFMIEEVRTASIGIVPEPPSSRSWGAIAIKAVKSGLISRKGYAATCSAKSHKTPASIWKVNK